MKQIIAVIRDECVETTKIALDAIGVRGVTFLHVTGRGEQKGRISARELAGTISRNIRFQLGNEPPLKDLPGNPGKKTPTTHPGHGGRSQFLPKRMLIIIALDEEINRIVQAIVSANQTGRHGDGRVFICPMISAMRIRTGEHGDRALM